jgi:hypothetical protein
MSASPSETSALWVAFCIVLGVLVGICAGLLAWLGGQDPPSAILAGGAAFGGTVALTLLIKKSLGY